MSSALPIDLTEIITNWTKNNPMNVQLVPDRSSKFQHILANKMGISGGEKSRSLARAALHRQGQWSLSESKPMMIDGKETYQIRYPDSLGLSRIAEDEGKTALTPVNLLSPAAIDPNAYHA